ncbi:MAG: rhodanese-like domain-containing protein [Bacteroidetes bacterium]|nr:rhodanese-like domain-containing protein [Bacteroidota bacterium]
MKYLIYLFWSLTLFSSNAMHSQKKSKPMYQCLPCGLDCDRQRYSKPGACKTCQMKLVKVATIKFKNIAPEKVCAYIAIHPKTILLDVRTAEEFNGKAEPHFGSLKNAINLPIQELEQRISELNQFKKSEILVYCSHSHRSPQASYILNQHGFHRVLNLSGGMSVLNDSTCKK